MGVPRGGGRSDDTEILSGEVDSRFAANCFVARGVTPVVLEAKKLM
jgi:hypothetical protein